MNDLVKEFIDKEVIVYVSGGNAGNVSGFIRKIEDGWIKVETANGQTEVISLDYISRIREYPRAKSGKKKSIILD